MGASGVHVGVVNADGMVERVAGVDDEGYRRQMVNLNGRVFGGSGDAAGVFLVGGGRVYIGPRGTVGADSGIAIRTTGDIVKFINNCTFLILCVKLSGVFVSLVSTSLNADS